jgi:hypothetical protein
MEPLAPLLSELGEGRLPLAVVLLTPAFPARGGTKVTGQKDANGKLFMTRQLAGPCKLMDSTSPAPALR